jgi:DNA mismatch repair protein MSH4
MIDVSTIHSLELVQNLHNSKSTDCLYGLLNETLTPMGARLLRNNVLQPVTDADVLTTRYAAIDDLTTKEEMFFATRAGEAYHRRYPGLILTCYSTEELPGCR